MDYFNQLTECYPNLASIKKDIVNAYSLLEEAYALKAKVLIAGNGGSAADALHIEGELMKGFRKQRRPPKDFTNLLSGLDKGYAPFLVNHLQQGLPAVALGAGLSLSSASLNDMHGDIVYAQQLYGLGNKGDIFWAISTSGNSKNIIYAALTARAKEMKVIALTGGTGGVIKDYADVSIIVPETETHKIQELHLPIYHALCLTLEERFFG